MDNYTDIISIELLNRAIVYMHGEYKHYCWRYNDIFQVIDCLLSQGYVILGGDVLQNENGIIKYTYDNWYYNIDQNKERNQLIAESKDVALNYLYECNNRYGDDGLYLLVYRKT